MKLNKYTLILAGGLSLSMMTSCNDFLDREPLDAITPETFLWNDADMSAYMIKQYSFSTHSGAGVGIWGNDNGTDNQCQATYSTSWIPGLWRVPDHYDQDSSDPWYFGALYNLNYFLETVLPRYEANELSGNMEMVKHNIGEAYFLRAWFYFNKLQTFGDFPIIQNVLKDEKEELVAASKRYPRNQVARFILEDLDRAISYLTNNPDGGTNRITLNAAYLVKSRVALYEASWETYHANTALVPGGPGWPGKAEDLNGYNADTEIKFFLAQCKEAAAYVADNIKLADNNHTWADGAAKMQNPYFAQFSADDMSSYPEIIMWRDYDVNLDIRHSAGQYLRTGGNTGFTRQFVETFLMKNGLPIYASGSNYQGDKSLQKVREGRDERLQMFMMTPNEVLTEGQKEFVDTLNTYPGLFSKEESRCVTGYQLRKGLSNNWTRDWNENGEGCPIFRAAEAYLNYIEASCMENGGTSIDSKAADLWRQLRERAGLPGDYNITVSATDLSKENDWAVYSGKTQVSSLLYNIRRERRCELMEEGFRMYDLKRWRALDRLDGTWQPEGINFWEADVDYVAIYKGWYEQTVKADGSSTANMSAPERGKYVRPYEIVNGESNQMWNTGYKWCEAHYLSPISIVHFRNTATNPSDLSTSIIYQNPGWPTVADQGPAIN